MVQSAVKLPLDAVKLLDGFGYQCLPLKQRVFVPNVGGKKREFTVDVSSATQVGVLKKTTFGSGIDWLNGDKGEITCSVIKNYTVRCMKASGFYHTPQPELSLTPSEVNGWLAKAKMPCAKNSCPLTLLLDIDSAVQIKKP